MQEENRLKSDVIIMVERIVCDCVNKVLWNPNQICPSTLYLGKTNTMTAVRIARGAVFSISHDRFGVSYYNISRHSGISFRNVIRSVGSYKNIPDSDEDVRRVKELIEVELKRFPLL